MRIRLAVALAVTLAAGACGGVPETKSAKSSGTQDAAMDAALPRVAEGRAVSDALSGFTCERDDDEGTWSASGAVVDRAKRPAAFQIMVYVGPADGRGASHRTKRVAAVQSKGSARFLTRVFHRPEYRRRRPR